MGCVSFLPVFVIECLLCAAFEGELLNVLPVFEVDCKRTTRINELDLEIFKLCAFD